MIQKNTPIPKINIFQNLTKNNIAELRTWLQPRQFPAGLEIFREAQLPIGLYILTRGEVGVLKSSPEGRVRLANLEAPCFFGEMALLEGAERSASVKALTDVSSFLLPTDIFVSKLNGDNVTALKIAVNVGRLVCRRLRDQNKKVATFAANNAARKRRIRAKPFRPTVK